MKDKILVLGARTGCLYRLDISDISSVKAKFCFSSFKYITVIKLIRPVTLTPNLRSDKVETNVKVEDILDYMNR